MRYDRQVFQTLSLISQLGFSIITPILLCTYVGVWLEKKFAIPVAVLLIVFGILAGVRNAYVLLKQAIQSPKESEEDQDGTR